MHIYVYISENMWAYCLSLGFNCKYCKYSEVWISIWMHTFFKHISLILNPKNKCWNPCVCLPPSGSSRLLLFCQLPSHSCRDARAKEWEERRDAQCSLSVALRSIRSRYTWLCIPALHMAATCTWLDCFSSASIISSRRWRWW